MRFMTPDTPSSRSPTNPKTMAAATASSPSPTPTATPAGLPQPRRRAIRTYGKKRPLADGADVNRAASISSETAQPTVSRESSPPATTASVEPSPKKHRRSGILRYFQPAPLPRSSAPASSSSSQCSASGTDKTALTDSTLHGSASAGGTRPPSPPSSPLPARPRQKRRLRMRPGGSDGSEKKAGNKAKTASQEDGQRPAGGGGMTTSSVRMRARMRARVLGMCGLEDQEQQASARKKALVPAAATQTTLSLTIGGDAMKECRECNILYNPLNEKDAKFHSRYHASLRRKRARQATETVVG